MKLTTQLNRSCGTAMTACGKARNGGSLHRIACLAVIFLGFGIKSAMAIVGGTPANWSHSPWLAMNVAMFPGQTQWQNCGCSSMIIDQNYAVTSGHCLTGPYPYKVGLMFSDGSVIQVAQEIHNPGYTYDPLRYKYVYGVVSSTVADIGLQKLAQPVGASGARQVLDIFTNIIFAELQPNLTGVTGTILGWGATQEAQVFMTPPAAFSPTLQQINEVVQPSGNCQADLNGIVDFLSGGVLTVAPFQFNSSLFCASPVGLTFTPLPPALPPMQGFAVAIPARCSSMLLVCPASWVLSPTK
jgi:hypothetical protein